MSKLKCIYSLYHHSTWRLSPGWESVLLKAVVAHSARLHLLKETLLVQQEEGWENTMIFIILYRESQIQRTFLTPRCSCSLRLIRKMKGKTCISGIKKPYLKWEAAGLWRLPQEATKEKFCKVLRILNHLQKPNWTQGNRPLLSSLPLLGPLKREWLNIVARKHQEFDRSCLCGVKTLGMWSRGCLWKGPARAGALVFPCSMSPSPSPSPSERQRRTLLGMKDFSEPWEWLLMLRAWPSSGWQTGKAEINKWFCSLLYS